MNGEIEKMTAQIRESECLISQLKVSDILIPVLKLRLKNYLNPIYFMTSAGRSKGRKTQSQG